MVISLEDIQFHAYHGVYPEEQKIGNTFLVSVYLTLPEVKAVQTDELADTVNYERIYELVAKEMAQPSRLLEHVSGRIRQAILDEWPHATVRIQIKKNNPPIGGKVAWATVEI